MVVKQRKSLRLNLVILTCAFLLLGQQSNAQSSSQPAQPASGPGSSQIVYGGVQMQSLGESTRKIYLFEPTSPSPSTTVPLIVFVHGFGGTNPKYYYGWIKHLVQRGYAVLYPVYQINARHPEDYTSDALSAILSALGTFGTSGHVSIQSDSMILIGHSLGGIIATNLAAMASTVGLPNPAFLAVVHPADTNAVYKSFTPILTSDFSLIPSSMLLLGIVGKDDSIAGDTSARIILESITQVTSYNKELIELISDSHGSPALVSNHFAPLSTDADFDGGETPLYDPPTDQSSQSESADALDFFGYWKFIDTALETLQSNSESFTPFGTTSEQENMGLWSDGTPVLSPVLFSSFIPLTSLGQTNSIKGQTRRSIRLAFSEAIAKEKSNLALITCTRGKKAIAVSIKAKNDVAKIRPKGKAGWPARGKIKLHVQAGFQAQSKNALVSDYSGITRIR